MLTKIYFVRHAQPDFSIKDDMVRPLTEKGIRDSRKVTRALLDKDIEHIYSSPFKRAVDTIENLAENLDLDINIDYDFCERIVGTWVEDFKTYSQHQWEDFDFKILNGECLREVQERNIGGIFRVLENNYGKNIVIGTHGTALSTILNYFDPDFGYNDFWKIIDRMPYVLCFNFKGKRLVHIEEIEIN
ncbi:MAG: histidine phosphatase family protein [Tissierellia bacterium]|jgi:2,3-bisphosphoglycerate-dependent phosphoglycerate mutase|nr:histidine phosphatase family protein [Tissierellia bacterium]